MLVYIKCCLLLITYFLLASYCETHIATKRLYLDLLSGYNRLIRPVNNYSSKLVVNMSLKLTQLLDINMKQQVMSTNVWVEQSWFDYKLRWNPNDYEGVEMINIPAEEIWVPDIVLFNNADGNYEVTLLTKALVYYTGKVSWKPPALFRSTCEIDVKWFPFDIQSCLMKFGSWTYDGLEVDLRHVKQKDGSKFVEVGIDMSEFYASAEWDILKVPAEYNNEYYDCCVEPYPDITFNITMRRKTLFYTVNLIIPAVGVSFLTLLVFYLPSDCGEKVTLSISILVSLTVFFLLLAEIIPPTSLAIPLLGKYLLFTMILVTLSICFTVGVLNVHFRSPSTHHMSSWMRSIFIDFMPNLLFMKRPTLRELAEELERYNVMNSDNVQNLAFNQFTNSEDYNAMGLDVDCFNIASNQLLHSNPVSWSSANITPEDCVYSSDIDSNNFFHHHHHHHHHPQYQDNHHNHNFSHNLSHSYSYNHNHKHPCVQRHYHHQNQPQPSFLLNSFHYSPELQKAIKSVLFIAEHFKKEDEEKDIIEDWKYVAMVLDRLFLWVLSTACVAATCLIILQAPSLYDKSVPIDSKLSSIGR